MITKLEKLKLIDTMAQAFYADLLSNDCRMMVANIAWPDLKPRERKELKAMMEPVLDSIIGRIKS